ncbi:hypothetical protein LCGC14_2327320 [marine sediment metagenome]|uniref:Uncharacterized protein n=1 Tax=marine sediment metagenome TaxID=412755 RepID=A0A0F9CG17_9ZZZZ
MHKKIGLAELEDLPITNGQEIPEEYRDVFGHMNVMWYARLFGYSFDKFGRLFGFDVAYFRANLIGTFSAAWGDCGLHDEVFWLGWAAMAQGSWTPGGAPVAQTVADFMDVFYGREVDDMVEVYRDLQSQASFWQQSWDRRPSKVRTDKGYGTSSGKRPMTRMDTTLLGPALPALPDLAFQPAFSARYAKLLAEAPNMLLANDRLLGRLHRNIVLADRNRHNIEVLGTMADFIRSHLEMLIGLAQAEDMLTQAFAAAEGRNGSQAVGLMIAARENVEKIIASTYRTFRQLVNVWEKSWYPRNVPVDGKEFVHVMDDVKDHFADRRADLSYHVAPFESIGLADWCKQLGEIIHAYAEANGLSVQALEEELMDD